MSKSSRHSSRDSIWGTLGQRPRAATGEAAAGYFQSSQDLRLGLEISVRPLSSLPEELAAAFGFTPGTALAGGSAPR